MQEFFNDYPYLLANLLSLVVFVTLGLVLLRKDHRKVMILSGLVNASCFGFIVHLEGVYWSPVRLGNRLPGIEDALCSFIVAAMLWFAVTLVLGKRITYGIRMEVLLKRFVYLAAMSAGVFLLLCETGGSGMTSLLLTCLVVAGITFLLQRDLWPLAAAGVVAFPLLYLIVVKIDFWIWPHFVAQWNAEGVWGRRLAGIPLGEIAWSFAYGVYWPLFTGYIFNASLRR